MGRIRSQPDTCWPGKILQAITKKPLNTTLISEKLKKMPAQTYIPQRLQEKLRKRTKLAGQSKKSAEANLSTSLDGLEAELTVLMNKLNIGADSGCGAFLEGALFAATLVTARNISRSAFDIAAGQLRCNINAYLNELWKEAAINSLEGKPIVSLMGLTLEEEIRFECQLAHGSPTGRVGGVNRIDQLYKMIADCYAGVHVDDILYCTVNTRQVDMTRLLSGRIDRDEFIFAHVKGPKTELEFVKKSPNLGLTISDNGVGKCFIKKIVDGSLGETHQFAVTAGDVIEKINGMSTLGMRHFEVATLLRALPVNETIKLRVIKPLQSGFSLTNEVKAPLTTEEQEASAFWEGKADTETLQRVYGISFPDPKQLKEWQKMQAEAAARDHRKLVREQELVTEFIRKQYRKRGFSEVISPNMYNAKLWQKSGHWEHYADNMFKIEIEKEFFGLKPMNCPGHCLMFESRPRTHAELPIRMADFGVLHRNEISGALSGLTRVRRFCQDDAHIFCRKDQVVDETKAALEFVKFVYADVFGFSFKLYLSTRPEEGYIGTVETWTDAEKQLEDALNEFGQKWELNPGDGAFYGPKIDITIMDALKRQHQCATLQLDFNLPERFNLHYSDAKGDRQRPVMLHRAILGSLERMIAILTENFGGKWPFWLSPRQIMIVPVHEKCHDYCEDLRKHLYDSGFEVETNVDPTESFNRKIRNAQLAQCNYILVVGEKEMTNGTVNVRTRDNKVHGEMSKGELVVRFKRLQDEYVKDSEEASEFHK